MQTAASEAHLSIPNMLNVRLELKRSTSSAWFCRCSLVTERIVIYLISSTPLNTFILFKYCLSAFQSSVRAELEDAVVLDADCNRVLQLHNDLSLLPSKVVSCIHFHAFIKSNAGTGLRSAN